MAGTITNIGSGTQIWGLSGSSINTVDLVNLEMQALEMKKSPILNRQQRLTEQKQVFTSFKSEFQPLLDMAKKMADFKGGAKPSSVSQSGYVTVTATADAIGGTYNVAVSQLAERHQIAGGAVADLNAQIGVDATVQINGKDVVVTSTMTYKNLIDQVNNGNYGVSMYTVGDRLFMTSTQTGTNHAIALVDSGAIFQSKLGFIDTAGSFTNELTAAANAKYTVNGVALESSSNTVENAIPSTTMKLENITTQDIKVTIENTVDNEAITMIQDMVKAYNNAMSDLDLFAGEGGYMQASSLSLATGKILNKAALFTLNGKPLSDYGIEVDKTGILIVNSQKLQDAYKSDPDAAKTFFFGTSGFGKQLSTDLDSIFGTTGSLGQQVKSVDDELRKIEEKISDIDQINAVKQENIIAKYAKFEQQMAALEMQLTYLKAVTGRDKDDK